MRRLLPLLGLLGLLAACATPVPPVLPPPVVATIAPPPPEIPLGGYVGMEIPAKRSDGRYHTPNIDMTPAAAVWHLRGALNVAALACNPQGGPIVDSYNGWLRARGPVLDAHVRQYMREWENTGWGDWQAAYDNAQTRLYNFYGQPAMRTAFCTVARDEAAAVAAVADQTLPDHARAALARLDQPFTDFYDAYDRWRAYYYAGVDTTPPPVVETRVTPPSVAPTLAPTLAVAPETP